MALDTTVLFWNFLTDLLTEEDYIEIRLFNVVNKNVYKLSKKFCKEHKINMKSNGAQLFFNAKKDFFEFKEFTKIKEIGYGCKVCYGLAARRFDSKGNISGSYKHTPNAHMIYFDIEKVDHTDTTEKEKAEIKKFIYDKVIPIFQKAGLKHFCLIDSGAGFHLLYKINVVVIDDERKRWFKKFITILASRASNVFFKVDPLYDFTRVFALPNTPNIKRKKMVKILKLDNQINVDFKMRRKYLKKQKETIKKGDHKIKNPITEEPLIKFMMSYKHIALQSGGELSRNAYLELQLAYLLRDNNISVDSIQTIINKINDNMNKKIQVSPKYLKADRCFNPNVVNKWSKICCGVIIYD